MWNNGINGRGFMPVTDPRLREAQEAGAPPHADSHRASGSGRQTRRDNLPRPTRYHLNPEDRALLARLQEQARWGTQHMYLKCLRAFSSRLHRQGRGSLASRLHEAGLKAELGPFRDSHKTYKRDPGVALNRLRNLFPPGSTRLRDVTDTHSDVMDVYDYPSLPQATDNISHRLQVPGAWLWDSDIFSYTDHIASQLADRGGGPAAFR